MNCQRYEHWALLETSREIGPVRRLLLRAHCARCPHCERFRAALPPLTQQARIALDPGDAGRNAAEAFVRSAPVPAGRRVRAGAIFSGFSLPLNVVRPVALAATLLLLTAAGILVLRDPSAPAAGGKPPASRFDLAEVDFWEINADLLAESLSELALEMRLTFQVEPPGLRDELDELALELLRLEGSA